MPAPLRDPEPPRPPGERWSAPDAGRRYRLERWRNPRHAARDPRLVARLLARAGVLDAVVLDAPCGTGRLLGTAGPFAGRARLCVGLDVSEAMLAEARAAGAPLVAGDVARLPFRDGAFDAVVACRLLHHLADPEAFRGAVRELVRVSRGVVIASFFDRGSLAGLRRARRHPGSGRVARPKAEVRAAFRAAGAEVETFAHTLRGVAQQAFALAVVRRR